MRRAFGAVMELNNGKNIHARIRRQIVQNDKGVNARRCRNFETETKYAHFRAVTFNPLA